MVTVSRLTKKILQEKPYIHEALEKELINIVALAEYIQPDIEKELGKVKTSAVSMAIRRYMGSTQKKYNRVTLTKRSELLLKSNLFEISVQKSPTLYKKIIKLYDIVDFTVGDTLNVIQGNYEILIVSNEKYQKKFAEILKGEHVQKIGKNLASLSIKIPKEFINAPGFYFALTKMLAMENIPIIDLVNTETEATFIFNDKDVARAYEIMKKEISVQYYE